MEILELKFQAWQIDGNMVLNIAKTAPKTWN